MGIKIPGNSALFETSYGEEFPVEQFYVTLFEEVASMFENKETYSPSVLSYFYANGFSVSNSIDIEKTKHAHNVKLLVLVNKPKKIIILASLNDEKKDTLVTLSYYYDCTIGPIQIQLEFNEIRKHKKEKKKFNINLITSYHGQLETEEYDIVIPDMDLVLNYGEDFLKFHDKVVKRLNTDKDKGIIFLHGDPGTGKCVSGGTKITIRNKKTGEMCEKNIEDLM